MIPRAWLIRLLALAILLPVAIVLLVATGALVASMGDDGAGRFLVRTAIVIGVLWMLDVVSLVAALGFEALDARREEHDEPPEH